MLPDKRGEETSNVVPTAVLVVGMHRSGTSALTGILSLAGVDLGPCLVPPAEDNPKGFFEHNSVWQIHHDLLVEIGSSWHDIRPLPKDWPSGQAAKKALARLCAELEHDFSKSQLWGVKDPRLSRCFVIWPTLLADLGVQPKVILALRDPLEVAMSLQKRDGLGLTHALALWLRYTLDAERTTRGMPRVMVEYDRLLADWRRELDRLRVELMLPLHVNSKADAIEDFLSPELRHNKADIMSATLPQPYADWCTRTVQAIRTISTDSQQSETELDEILRAFNSHLDNALAEQSTVFLKQIYEQENTIRHLDREREKLTFKKDELQTVSERLAVERERLQLEREIFEKEILDIERQKITNDRDHSLSLQEQINRERARWACSHSELVTARNALRDAQWQIDHTKNELDRVYKSRSWRITRPLRGTFWRLRQVRQLVRDVRGVITQVSYKPTTQITPQAISSRLPAPRWYPDRASHDQQRLLIVTPDLHGPIRNGGIGTAFSALAETATKIGFDVTVAYALGHHSEDGPISRWVEHYAENGIKLVPIEEQSSAPIIDAPWYRVPAWNVHNWLSKNQQGFDLVIFPEWMGLAYYVLLAKSQGLDYGKLIIAINTHSPESWAIEGNRQLPEWPDAIDRDFMERECVRRADVLISPSAYMLDWMTAHNWQLTERRMVLPNLMPPSLREGQRLARTDRKQNIDRVVFFGRLEPRKGLKLFCDGMDRLSVDVRKQIGSVVFLGKAIATVGGFDSRQFIAQRSAQWGIRVEVLTDRNRDGALAELERPGTLAVIPSLVENSPYTVLECLTRRIVFLASRVGGIPEMLSPDDHDSHLFVPNPRALAQAMEVAILDGLRPAALAWEEEELEERWRTALHSLSKKENRLPVRVADDTEPLVSVCLVHYNRPHLLTQALDSLREQTYRNFEVILVDDGSPSEEATAYLDAIESEFASRRWQIIRQPNSYLGAARNTAAQAANGEYLLFMDDDNVATPDMLTTFVNAAVASGADVLTCPTMPFSSDHPPARPERIWLPLGGAAGAGLYRNAFGDANALWKRSAFEQVGGYTTDYGVGHEDWELFADAVLSGLRLELVPKPLYWYRVNPRGMLRAGDHWVDHARSVRPYLRHDPHGLGVALAYGLYLQRLREVGTQPAAQRSGRWRALLRAARLANDPSLRAQFIGAVRSQGLRVAIRRALAKAGR